MGVFYQRVGALAGHTAAGAYGTAVNMTLNSNARKIIGLATIGVHPTYTTAEGATHAIRVNSNGMGISNTLFPCGPYTQSGPATNSGGHPAVVKVIPVDWDCKGGEVLTFDVTMQGASTAAALFEVSVVYLDDDGVPSWWMNRFPNNMAGMRRGGFVGAQQLTTTRTALTAINVEDIQEAVIAVQTNILKTGAITAAEEIIGWFELRTSKNGTDPQELPTCQAASATLGTPVDHTNIADVPYLPVYIELAGTNRIENITPYINLRTAISTDARVSCGIMWR